MEESGEREGGREGGRRERENSHLANGDRYLWTGMSPSSKSVPLTLYIWHTSNMKHWKMVNAVAAMACSVKITSLSWTGLTPPGWRSLYWSCNHVGWGERRRERDKR